LTTPRAVLLLGLIAALVQAPPRVLGARYDQAPEFPSQNQKDWIGAPQSLKALSGKVVILDVWTFG
jgi:hypothetical protein